MERSTLGAEWFTVSHELRDADGRLCRALIHPHIRHIMVGPLCLAVEVEQIIEDAIGAPATPRT